MPEQFTTYWPTYEGLRELQEEDKALLAALLLVPVGYQFELTDYIQISNLRITIRDRQAKMDAFEKLARDILANQLRENILFTELKANDYDQPL